MKPEEVDRKEQMRNLGNEFKNRNKTSMEESINTILNTVKGVN